MTRSLNIRPAVREDAAQILDFIRQLAIYEKAEHEVLASEDDILRHVLQDDAVASALICERDGVAIGFAVYFFSYSTWLGKPGLFLEDLFVLPEHRGDGAGKAGPPVQYVAIVDFEPTAPFVERPLAVDGKRQRLRQLAVEPGDPGEGAAFFHRRFT